ncbi:DUF6582 domain-containing protein [Sphingomonas endolithica]|uniref:DUF6582 domain-containing protein n=1 Tax=Sphingomonas endolithica TaxID=2972485 RepID=UPI003AAE4B24
MSRLRPAAVQRNQIRVSLTVPRNEVGKGSFAFTKERKEPLKNASHVRNAIARLSRSRMSLTRSATPRESASRRRRRSWHGRVGEELARDRKVSG